MPQSNRKSGRLSMAVEGKNTYSCVVALDAARVAANSSW